MIYLESVYLSNCVFVTRHVHRTGDCITVCGKLTFDSNLKVSLSLTQDYLHYTYFGNEMDEIKFVGVLHAIREVPTEVVQIISNIK